MKKRVLTAVLVVVMLLSALLAAGCSLFDDNVTVVLNNRGEIQKTYTISIFKNAVLADIETEHVIGVTEVEEDGVMVEKDVEFLGWHPDPGAENGMYKAKGLCRYVEVEEYIRDGVVVLYAIYGVKVIEKHDLVIAWYGQAVAGLTDAIMDNYYTALINWLEDDLRIMGLDIVLRKYTGDVAASCAEVLADGGADIMLGWGGNLPTVGGIPSLERQSGVDMGNRTGRYIDLIRETTKMFDAETSLSKRIFDWSVANTHLFL